MINLRSFTLILFAQVSLARNSFSQDHVEIKLTCRECIGQEWQIKTHKSMLSPYRVLSEGIIDSTGIVKTAIQLDDRDILGLSVGHNLSIESDTEELYVEPGSFLQLVRKDSTWVIEGDLKHVGQYVKEMQKSVRERFNSVQKSLMYGKTLDSTEIRNVIEKLTFHNEQTREKIAQDKLLDPAQKMLLSELNAVPEKCFELFLDTQRIISNVLIKGDSTYTDRLLPADLAEHLIDRKLFLSPRYLFDFNMNLSVKMGVLARRYSSEGAPKPDIYTYLKSYITPNLNLVSISDYVLAYTLCNRGVLSEMTFEEIEASHNAWKAEFPSSPFREELDQILGEYAALRPGAPAKDFEMVSVEGDVFKLSDFKGKLVYVDLWATWCSPCREEFKYSKELSARYKDRSDIAFLYVSTDSNAEAWRKFLIANPELTGFHGLQQGGKERDPKEEKKSIFQLYKALGLPHYILIDKKGNIISPKAPRPSELVNTNYLDELLKL